MARRSSCPRWQDILSSHRPVSQYVASRCIVAVSRDYEAASEFDVGDHVRIFSQGGQAHYSEVDGMRKMVGMR